jgi:phosphomannomutase
MGFFKAYDMRGTFGKDFDLALVRRVGEALPAVVGGGRWLVGRDCRVTSEAIRDALVEGLTAAGADVTDIGLCTTPMLYYHTASGGFDGSVMVTASHNPPTDNGLKVSKKSALPVGYADGLDKVERLVQSPSPQISKSQNPKISKSQNPKIEYIDFIKSITTRPASSLRYAVDCSNGMASLLAAELFPGATILNGERDGRFPAHSPNPLAASAREEMSEYVRRNALDCGIIFDGDADRAAFIDETGAFVQPDYLIPFVAAASLKRTGRGSDRPVVIHDVRTSRGVIEAIREMDCEPVMVPVGHAFAKPMMRKLSAVCGGELAGHYYFGDFFGCDSGALAALRILEEVAAAKAAGETFSAKVRRISGRYANSGEINFKVEDKDAATARMIGCATENFGPEISRTEIDGVRIEWPEGWINVRKSNTEPYLRLVAECDTGERLRTWTDKLAKAAVRQ